jgi:protease YdgD
MRPRHAILGFLLVALLGVGPAMADPAQPPQMAPSALANGLDAIARLRGALMQAGGCSAVLIAPDRALTAAHCARGATEGPNRLTLTFRPAAPEPLHRAAVAAVRLHADVPPEGRPAPAADLALLLLDEPVPEALVAPIPLADGAAPPRTTALFGYINPDREILHGHDTCMMMDLAPGLIGSDCRVVSGFSGAPLLSGGPGTWRVEGIAVATVDAAPLRALIVDVVPWPDIAGE